jgi:hypothetical protein
VQPGKILQPPSRLRLVVRHQRQGMAEVLLRLQFLAPAQRQGPQAAQERLKTPLMETGFEAWSCGFVPRGVSLD